VTYILQAVKILQINTLFNAAFRLKMTGHN